MNEACYIIKRWMLWMGVLLPAVLTAQNKTEAREMAFAGGEKLVYAVSYKVGIVHSDVAEVTFNTTLERVGEQKIYRIEANGKTYPFFNWFFNLNDTYVSRLEAETLRPLDLQIEIREGGYRVSSGYRYDWSRKQVSTFFFNVLQRRWEKAEERRMAMLEKKKRERKIPGFTEMKKGPRHIAAVLEDGWIPPDDVD